MTGWKYVGCPCWRRNRKIISAWSLFVFLCHDLHGPAHKGREGVRLSSHPLWCPAPGQFTSSSNPSLTQRKKIRMKHFEVSEPDYFVVCWFWSYDNFLDPVLLNLLYNFQICSLVNLILKSILLFLGFWLITAVCKRGLTTKWLKLATHDKKLLGLASPSPFQHCPRSSTLYWTFL